MSIISRRRPLFKTISRMPHRGTPRARVEGAEHFLGVDADGMLRSYTRDEVSRAIEIVLENHLHADLRVPTGESVVLIEEWIDFTEGIPEARIASIIANHKKAPNHARSFVAFFGVTTAFRAGFVYLGTYALDDLEPADLTEVFPRFVQVPMSYDADQPQDKGDLLFPNEDNGEKYVLPTGGYMATSNALMQAGPFAVNFATRFLFGNDSRHVVVVVEVIGPFKDEKGAPWSAVDVATSTEWARAQRHYTGRTNDTGGIKLLESYEIVGIYDGPTEDSAQPGGVHLLLKAARRYAKAAGIELVAETATDAEIGAILGRTTKTRSTRAERGAGAAKAQA